MPHSRFFPSLAATLLLGACTAGPDYGGPPVAAPVAGARGAFLRGDPAAGVTDAAPAARWWEALGDPVLNRLVTQALDEAPDIAIANARIAQARAGLAANRTALLPTIGASLSAPYINIPGGLLDPSGQTGGRDSINVYNAGFDASWEIDLFGGTRRKIEAASAREQAAVASLADARVTLSAEIARAYVALRARQTANALLERQHAIDTGLVTLAQQRLRAGTAPGQPLAQARATLAQTEADLARGRADATVLTDQLAVLAGKEPGALDTALAAPAPVPLPPAEVAVGDPARLLRARPDLRAAERQLAAATADVGVQVANRYPKISFLGLLGLGGQNLGDVFDPKSVIGLAVPRLTWSLFDGGRTEAQIRNARAAREEAEARFDQAVLRALQDAEAALARFGGQRTAYARTLAAETEAQRVAQLQSQRAGAGTLSRSDALGADRQALQAALAASAARAELTGGFVAVEKALGLGWEVPQASADSPK